jgi:hypothetical protein
VAKRARIKDLQRLLFNDLEMEVGSKHKQGVTGGSSRAREVLRALRITALAPPQALKTT